MKNPLTRDSHVLTLVQQVTAERDFEGDHKKRHDLSQRLVCINRLLSVRGSDEPDTVGWFLENLKELGRRLYESAYLKKRTVELYVSLTRTAIRSRLTPESRRYSAPLRGRVVPSAIREISPEREESVSLQGEIETLFQTAMKLPTLGRVISRALREIAGDIAV